MHDLTFWQIKDGRCVRSPESEWRKPIEWQNAFTAERAATDPQCRSFSPPRPIIRLTHDVFEPFDGPVVDEHGDKLFREYFTGEVRPVYGWTRVAQIVPLTIADLRHAIFPMIATTPDCLWVLPTRHPGLVRDGWLSRDMGLGHTLNQKFTRSTQEATRLNDPSLSRELFFRSNTAILAGPIKTQAEANELLPELLRLSDLTPVLGLLVDPREEIDLTPWMPCSRCTGKVSAGWEHAGKVKPDDSVWRVCPECKGCPYKAGCLGWLIVEGTDEPIYPDHVRSLLDQCAAAEVPFYFAGWRSAVLENYGDPKNW